MFLFSQGQSRWQSFVYPSLMSGLLAKSFIPRTLKNKIKSKPSHLREERQRYIFHHAMRTWGSGIHRPTFHPTSQAGLRHLLRAIACSIEWDCHPRTWQPWSQPAVVTTTIWEYVVRLKRNLNGDSGVERNKLLWIGSPPIGATLKAVPVFVNMQQQGLVSISMVNISTREHWTSFFWAANWDHIDIQWQCRTDSTPHALLHSVERK